MSDNKYFTEENTDTEEFCNGERANFRLTEEQVNLLRPFLSGVLKQDIEKGFCLTLAQIVFLNAFEGIVRARYFSREQAKRVYDGISAVLKSEGIE